MERGFSTDAENRTGVILLGLGMFAFNPTAPWEGGSEASAPKLVDVWRDAEVSPVASMAEGVEAEVVCWPSLADVDWAADMATDLSERGGGLLNICEASALIVNL